MEVPLITFRLQPLLLVSSYSVYHCSQKNLSMLAIDNIQFGQSGTFALNIWFRATNLTGHLFQYLVSLDEDMGASRTVWGEQLNVYLGEVEHVLFGLVRTVFKVRRFHGMSVI